MSDTGQCRHNRIAVDTERTRYDPVRDAAYAPLRCLECGMEGTAWDYPGQARKFEREEPEGTTFRRIERER